MNKFIIIKIEENHLIPDGHAFIIYANRVNNMPELEPLSEMFGKKYYIYSTSENDNTEIFIVPYSEIMREMFLSITQKEQGENFWEPDLHFFYDSHILLRDGTRKKIHKSIDFRMMDNSNKHLIKYIPPSGKGQFSYKEYNGIKYIVYFATQLNVIENSDNKFSWNTGDIDLFIFSNNEYHNKMLNEALLLDPWKREFWELNLNDFYKYKINRQGILGTTTHNLYISKDLAVKTLIENINQVLQ